MRAREVNSRILRLGGVMLRQRGSHRVFEASRDGVIRTTSVPQHTGDIPIGTLRAIERDLVPVFGQGWLR